MKKPFLHLKEKILLYMLLTALLLANIAAIHIGVASPDETKLYVDPPSIIDPTLTPGKSFSINVTIANVTDLYGFEFKLRYNTTILTGLGVIIVPFPNQTDYTSNMSINDDEGIVFVNVTYHSPAEPLTTTDPATLARIFFWAAAVGSTDLDLYDTKLVDDKALLIDHSVEGGYFSNLLLPPVAPFTHSPLLPLVNEIVTFNASASYDPDGYIANYTWDFDDGNTTTVTDPVIKHVYTAVATYNVTLTVTDNASLTDSTTKTITVAKLSSSISISPSPTTIKVGETTTISGSIIPVRVGVTVTIHSRLAGGTWDTLTTVLTNEKSQYSYVWTPPEAGTYDVKASWLGDANTLGAESTVETIAVEKLSSAITCSVSPDAILIGESVTVSGDIEPDHDGVTVTLDFTKPDDAHELLYTTTNSTGGCSAVYTPDMAGDWSVTASSEGDEDHDGATSAPASFTVTLLPEVGWIDGTIIDAETLDAIEGATVEAARARPRSAYFAVTDASGYYKIEVPAPAAYNVTASADGYYSQTVYNISVDIQEHVTKNFTLQLPPPVASFTYEPVDPFLNQTVTFDASGSTPNSGVLIDPDSYAWDFDSDGVIDAYGMIVNRTYTAAGNYTVTLTVTDNDKLTSATTRFITVQEAPPPAPPAPLYTMYLVAVIAIVVLAATAIYYLKKKR